MKTPPATPKGILDNIPAWQRTLVLDNGAVHQTNSLRKSEVLEDARLLDKLLAMEKEDDNDEVFNDVTDANNNNIIDEHASIKEMVTTIASKQPSLEPKQQQDHQNQQPSTQRQHVEDETIVQVHREDVKPTDFFEGVEEIFDASDAKSLRKPIDDEDELIVAETKQDVEACVELSDDFFAQLDGEEESSTNKSNQLSTEGTKKDQSIDVVTATPHVYPTVILKNQLNEGENIVKTSSINDEPSPIFLESSNGPPVKQVISIRLGSSSSKPTKVSVRINSSKSSSKSSSVDEQEHDVQPKASVEETEIDNVKHIGASSMQESSKTIDSPIIEFLGSKEAENVEQKRQNNDVEETDIDNVEYSEQSTIIKIGLISDTDNMAIENYTYQESDQISQLKTVVQETDIDNVMEIEQSTSSDKFETVPASGNEISSSIDIEDIAVPGMSDIVIPEVDGYLKQVVEETDIDNVEESEQFSSSQTLNRDPAIINFETSSNVEDFASEKSDNVINDAMEDLSELNDKQKQTNMPTCNGSEIISAVNEGIVENQNDADGNNGDLEAKKEEYKQKLENEIQLTKELTTTPNIKTTEKITIRLTEDEVEISSNLEGVTYDSACAEINPRVGDEIENREARIERLLQIGSTSISNALQDAEPSRDDTPQGDKTGKDDEDSSGKPGIGNAKHSSKEAIMESNQEMSHKDEEHGSTQQENTLKDVQEIVTENEQIQFPGSARQEIHENTPTNPQDEITEDSKDISQDEILRIPEIPHIKEYNPADKIIDEPCVIVEKETQQEASSMNIPKICEVSTNDTVEEPVKAEEASPVESSPELQQDVSQMDILKESEPFEGSTTNNVEGLVQEKETSPVKCSPEVQQEVLPICISKESEPSEGSPNEIAEDPVIAEKISPEVQQKALPNGIPSKDSPNKIAEDDVQQQEVPTKCSSVIFDEAELSSSMGISKQPDVGDFPGYSHSTAEHGSHREELIKNLLTKMSHLDGEKKQHIPLTLLRDEDRIRITYSPSFDADIDHEDSEDKVDEDGGNYSAERQIIVVEDAKNSMDQAQVHNGDEQILNDDVDGLQVQNCIGNETVPQADGMKEDDSKVSKLAFALMTKYRQAEENCVIHGGLFQEVEEVYDEDGFSYEEKKLTKNYFFDKENEDSISFGMLGDFTPTEVPVVQGRSYLSSPGAKSSKSSSPSSPRIQQPREVYGSVNIQTVKKSTAKSISISSQNPSPVLFNFDETVDLTDEITQQEKAPPVEGNNAKDENKVSKKIKSASDCLDDTQQPPITIDENIACGSVANVECEPDFQSIDYKENKVYGIPPNPVISDTEEEQIDCVVVSDQQVTPDMLDQDEPIPVEVAVTEVTPEDVTPTELTPIEVTPTEVTPTEVIQTEVTPTEVTPTEVTPTEVTPTEVTSIEVTQTEVTPTEVTPTEVTSTEVTPTEVTSTEVTPTEVTPTEVTPTEVTSTEVTPTEVTPTEVTSIEVTQTEVTPTEVTSIEVTPTEVTPTEVTTTEITTPEVTPVEATLSEIASDEVRPNSIQMEQGLQVSIDHELSLTTDDRPNIPNSLDIPDVHPLQVTDLDEMTPDDMIPEEECFAVVLDTINEEPTTTPASTIFAEILEDSQIKLLEQCVESEIHALEMRRGSVEDSYESACHEINPRLEREVIEREQRIRDLLNRSRRSGAYDDDEDIIEVSESMEVCSEVRKGSSFYWFLEFFNYFDFTIFLL